MKILKIGAVWCNGCLVMRPRWGEIEKEMPDLVTEYHDFDQEHDIVKQYHIESGVLPVAIFIGKNNQELARLTGEVDKAEIIKTIKAYQKS
jgi:thiol-disulfide isomerase/thioredoxin